VTLRAELAPVSYVRTGRLKFVAGDLGTLTGLQTPAAHPGWVLLNGATMPNSGAFTALFAMVGTRFGGAGVLPALIDGRVPIPKGASAFPTAGVAGGEINHVLSLAEYPNHYHLYIDSEHPAVAYGPGGFRYNQANIDGWDPWDRNGDGVFRTSNGFGGGGAHSNMPPYVVVGGVLCKL
jgi:microcystin-dependent protein